ncbi:hypothetical protein QBC33DRAFT_533799 [Phialemonium atrogriseum]|uniref:Uncharacterized protein n=1 Tax=Phialemonium atrogriseum TaxID=1093897 RepID=A0AAJ0C297_9PEZI|nr:uncharacterized protein QBC33DRAFT_533799 [Phialemonium atrogriseum]KAK1768819.1 hypothetical protein QBC33DRAFT_533799 [Phialemonium atrogriseum]
MKVQSPKPGVRTEESIPGPAQQNRLQSASPVAETAAVARQASDPIMDWQAHILSLDPRVQFANEGTPGGPSPAGHMPSQPPAPRTKMTDEDTSDPGPATPAPGRSVDPGAERVARENGAHSPAWEARAYSVGTAAEMAVQGSRASSAAHQERVQSVDEWVDMVVQEDGAAHTAPPTRQARANPVDLGVDIADEVSDSETVRGEELVSDSMEIDSGTR